LSQRSCHPNPLMRASSSSGARFRSIQIPSMSSSVSRRYPTRSNWLRRRRRTGPPRLDTGAAGPSRLSTRHRRDRTPDRHLRHKASPAQIGAAARLPVPSQELSAPEEFRLERASPYGDPRGRRCPIARSLLLRVQDGHKCCPVHGLCALSSTAALVHYERFVHPLFGHEIPGRSSWERLG
jgi:hypothetical protein